MRKLYQALPKCLYYSIPETKVGVYLHELMRVKFSSKTTRDLSEIVKLVLRPKFSRESINSAQSTLYDSLALNSIMCIRLNIDYDFLILFYPSHVFIGVYFPGIIISRSKLHVEHRLLFKVKTTTRLTRMHWLVFFHEKRNAFQRLYEKSRFSANRKERHAL